MDRKFLRIIMSLNAFAIMGMFGSEGMCALSPQESGQCRQACQLIRAACGKVCTDMNSCQNDMIKCENMCSKGACH